MLNSVRIIPRRSVVEQTLEDLLKGVEPERLSAGFTKQGYEPPFILWSPLFEDLPHPLLRRFAQICDHLADENGRVRRSMATPDAFYGLLDWLMLLDVEDAGQNFRYRHYGEGIAGFRGASLAGKTSTFFSGHISTLFTALYQAVTVRKERVLSAHQPPRSILVCEWKRLIVPLFDEAGEVVEGMAVVNVPDADIRVGLDVVPDPVLIADREVVVRYANIAAQRVFGQQFQFGSRIDLFGYAGISLDNMEPPENLARSQAIRDRVCLGVKDGLVQRFHLTISGLSLHDRSFYVITLRPELTEGL